MKIKVIVHNAEEGGYWAEVPAIKGCYTQADDWESLIANIYMKPWKVVYLSVTKAILKSAEIEL